MARKVDPDRGPSLLSKAFWAAMLLALVVAVWWTVRTHYQNASDVFNEAAPSGEAGQRAEPRFVESVQITSALDIAAWDENKSMWPTELFHDQVQQQLRRLAQILRRPSGFDESDLATIFAANFSCGRLRPKNLEACFRDRQLAVYRCPDEQSTSATGDADEEFRGLAGCLQALREYCQPLAESGDRDFEFKVVTIDNESTGVTTGVVVHASGHSARRVAQLNGMWLCRWSSDAANNSPRMSWLENDMAAYEEVVRVDPSRQLFTDLTQRVLGDNASLATQLVPSTNFWMARLDSVLGSDIIGSYGVALADVNGDDLEDVYICQPGGLPNRLFIQNFDGTATDISSAAGVDFCDASQHALFIDMDNDGDQDLAVLLENTLVVLENVGQTRFEARARQRVYLNPNGLAAADVDGDALLDIYVLNHDSEQDRRLLGNPIPFQDANNGGANVLLKNVGDWRFTDVTAAVGLDQNNRRFTLAAAFEDFDNDGDADLYVANDFGRNNLYRNDIATTGRFVDIAARVGVEDTSAGMSVSWADHNNDGWMDLYVSNMFSSAGHRVAYQQAFQPRASDNARLAFQRHARGNSLFQHVVRDGLSIGFRDVSVESRVTLGRWAWASRFVDINNDTWQDLLVANGFITNENSDDL